jgi:hypothetical protein
MVTHPNRNQNRPMTRCLVPSIIGWRGDRHQAVHIQPFTIVRARRQSGCIRDLGLAFDGLAEFRVLTPLFLVPL